MTTTDRPSTAALECDGLCVTSDDIGVPGYGVAYPHPACPVHGSGEVCGCGNPDQCTSPTHHAERETR